jgi:hypothetical protein
MMGNKLKFILGCIFIFSITSLSQPKQNINWDPFKFLIGKWVGEGNGEPGQGRGAFTLNYDLDKNILVRKNHDEFPATKDKPASIHDDLMIIYPGAERSFRAIYFDNENHIINYTVSSEHDKLVFLSDKIQSTPQFKLTYIQHNEAKIDIIFEMAMPDNPDVFIKYLEGSALKQ